MKDNQHVKPVIDLEARTITFKIKGHPDRVLHMDKVHPAVKERAAYAGLAQVRIVDMAAIGMTDEEGNIIPEAERIEMKDAAIGRGVAHYESGTPEWSMVSAGGGGGAKSITIEAIAKVKRTDYAKAEEMVERLAAEKFAGDRKKALTNLRGAKAVQEAIAAIRAERQPAPKADADALVSELGA